MHTRTASRWTVPALAFALVAATACEQREANRPAEQPAAPAPATAASPTDVTPGWITTKIQAQYFANPDIKPWNIDVDTSYEGVVTLRGEVDTTRDRSEAVRIARATAGVTRVDDMLRVKGETAATTGTDAPAMPTADAASTPADEPDLWITTKIRAKYFTDDDVRGRTIDVDTENGVVTLRGIVESYAARRQAVTLARNTEGVREVRDELRVETRRGTAAESTESQVDDAWIATKIQSKYFLDPDVKGRRIDVTAEGGTVTLAGTVQSDGQKRTAEQIARETEGVKDVRNEIQVAAEGATR